VTEGKVLSERIWRPGKPIDAEESRYPGFRPGTEEIAAGACGERWRTSGAISTDARSRRRDFAS